METLGTIRAASAGFKQLRDQCRVGGPPLFRSEKSLQYYFDFMYNYSEAVLRAKEEGKKLLWYSIIAPSELFSAFESLVPVCLELFSLTGMAFTQGSSKKFLDISAGYGIPVEFCSAHRIMDGMVINEEIPAPDFLVGSTDTCDSIVRSWEIIQDQTQVSKYLYDIPFHSTEESVEYLTGETERLAGFLEEQTGEKLDLDRLREVIRVSQRADSMYRVVNELRKNIPSPMHSNDYANNLVMNLLGGTTPLAVEYYETLLGELRMLISQKKGVVEKEIYRLAWFGGVPLFARELLGWMEKEYGAVVVLEPNMLWLDDERMDPHKPMEYLARKILTRCIRSANCGPLANTLPIIARRTMDYSCDGGVYFAHIGCQQGCGALRVRRDVIQEQVGIPLIVLDGDLCDPTVVTVEEMRGKLEEFFEILEEKKGRS